MIDLIGKREEWGKPVTSDKHGIEEAYANEIRNSTQRMYLTTEGQWWIDRVTVPSTQLQRDRLGGVAEWRGTFYPGHVVSWRFKAPASGEDVAILVQKPKLDEFTVLVYNTKRDAVQSSMIAWDIAPGMWEATIGKDTNGDDVPDGATETRTVALERTGSMDITFAPGVTTVVRMKLVSKGTPYWDRPDLGIGPDDVKAGAGGIAVTVHNIGAADAPASGAVLVDASGKTLATAAVPALAAPLDLAPKTAKITIPVPRELTLPDAGLCSIRGVRSPRSPAGTTR